MKKCSTSATHQLCILQRCIEIMYSGTKNPYHNITLGKQSCLRFSHFRVLSFGKEKQLAPGLANVWPPGSVKFANALPQGLTGWANAPQ